MKTELVWLVCDGGGNAYSAYPGENRDLAAAQADSIGGRVYAKLITPIAYELLAAGANPAELGL